MSILTFVKTGCKMSDMTTHPVRNFRPPPELWQDAKVIAAGRGETLTHVLTEALRRYVKRNTP